MQGALQRVPFIFTEFFDPRFYDFGMMFSFFVFAAKIKSNSSVIKISLIEYFEIKSLDRMLIG